jgi:hypothetical protein
LLQEVGDVALLVAVHFLQDEIYNAKKHHLRHFFLAAQPSAQE